MSVDLSKFELVYTGESVPDLSRDGVFVFSTVRNEALRMPHFLDYYRKLGAALFVIADNESDDGTFEFLRQQDDVILYTATGRYSESRCGIDWLNAMLDAYGRNKWCLSVDADELLVFPHSEHLTLDELTRYLERNDANALPTFLLDMYSKGPIRDAQCEPGTRFLDICPYFDAEGYLYEEESGPTRRVPTRGGPRSRLFWDGRNREKPAPYLAKLPLIKWASGMSYKASTHKINNAHVADISGVLLHFKFFADFAAQVELETARGEHFNNALQYSVYWEVMQENPNLSAYSEGSKRFENSGQLLDIGLMQSSDTIERLFRSESAASDRYFIKPGYRCTKNPIPYQDTEEDSVLYQVPVYQYVADEISKHGMNNVLDVGCGLGSKLESHVLPTGATIVGVDEAESIEFCSKRHRFGSWHIDDIEQPYADLGERFDMVVSADVIEHLHDPDKLFEYFRRWTHPASRIIISTPERDLRRGPDDMGPPRNPAHIREWNEAEFKTYLQSQGLTIEDFRIVELKPGMKTCQLALCTWNERQYLHESILSTNQ